MGSREASHAGSWYTDDGSSLTRQLDGWLSQVPAEISGLGQIPQSGARAVISPHAGYAYSGPCAAWAYKSLDLSEAKRIFILHPSHHHSLSTIALPTLDAYETPLSPEPLRLDKETIADLASLSTSIPQSSRILKFTTMSASVDEAEHSMEMQLPYIHRLLQKLYQNPSEYPPLVPMMVGSTSVAVEAAFGKLLAPYIADQENAFVLSSDFCHWGARFSYTYYVPDSPSPATDPFILPPRPSQAENLLHLDPSIVHGRDLSSRDKTPSKPTIYESIAHVDRGCMCAIATGEHAAFAKILQETGNTICGRHPIGVFMAGVEEVRRASGKGEDYGQFKFVRYERSSDAVHARDSSVSYVSGFAVL